MSGKWERSTFGAGDLDALVADGVVVEGDVRLPGDESIPVPAVDERVCFQAFFPRGFALPLHPFVRGLLYSYRLQLHDLMMRTSLLLILHPHLRQLHILDQSLEHAHVN